MFDFPPPSWQDLNEIQQQPLTSAFQLHWSPPTVTSLLLLVWLMLPVCVADLAVAVGWCFGGVIDRGVYVCSLINVTDLRGWFGPSYRHLPHAGASALPLLLSSSGPLLGLLLLLSSPLLAPCRGHRSPLLWGRREVGTVTSPQQPVTPSTPGFNCELPSQQKGSWLWIWGKGEF